MILVDIPQVAYKTWGFEYRVLNKDGSRNRELELQFEQDLQRHLSQYPYSSEHKHVR